MKRELAVIAVVFVAIMAIVIYGATRDTRPKLDTTDGLYRCPVCDHDIATDATMCQNCGHYTKNDRRFERSSP